jgi:hypothetical protein
MMGTKMVPSGSMDCDAALAGSKKCILSRGGCFKTVEPVWPLEFIRWAAKKSGAPATGVLCALVSFTGMAPV